MHASAHIFCMQYPLTPSDVYTNGGQRYCIIKVPHERGGGTRWNLCARVAGHSLQCLRVHSYNYVTRHLGQLLRKTWWTPQVAPQVL